MQLINGIYWVDGTAFDFAVWADGNPDLDRLYETGACIDNEDDGIADRDDDEEYPSICQKGVISLKLPRECPSPFIPLGDRCIYLNENRITWMQALDACTSMCANCTLASVHNQNEIYFIQKMLYAA